MRRRKRFDRVTILFIIGFVINIASLVGYMIDKEYKAAMCCGGSLAWGAIAFYFYRLYKRESDDNAAFYIR